ncbi:MAG: type II toxin-antitoxin system PemK/MazF family toxin [Gemmatimonadetes bacterium]|nr:type II toxin-antitoxin system PemK/MazF family toxin [Gemmatimonadota bacterium]
MRAHRGVEVAQAEVWWAELPEPAGSGPGFRRPVVVVQGNPLNRSRLATVVCVPLTRNLTWAEAPGNTLLPAEATGLPKDSVANAAQVITIDRSFLGERVGRLGPKQFAQILHGIDVVLGR